MDPTTEFFDRLMRRGPVHLSGRTSGLLRFELLSDGHTDVWRLRIVDGEVTLTLEERSPDCVVRMDKSLFDRLAQGQADVITAILGNRLRVEGDLILLIMFARVFPGPPDAHDPRTLVRDRRSTS